MLLSIFKKSSISSCQSPVTIGSRLSGFHNCLVCCHRTVPLDRSDCKETTGMRWLQSHMLVVLSPYSVSSPSSSAMLPFGKSPIHFLAVSPTETAINLNIYLPFHLLSVSQLLPFLFTRLRAKKPNKASLVSNKKHFSTKLRKEKVNGWWTGMVCVTLTDGCTCQCLHMPLAC